MKVASLQYIQIIKDESSDIYIEDSILDKKDITFSGNKLNVKDF